MVRQIAENYDSIGPDRAASRLTAAAGGSIDTTAKTSKCWRLAFSRRGGSIDTTAVQQPCYRSQLGLASEWFIKLLVAVDEVDKLDGQSGVEDEQVLDVSLLTVRWQYRHNNRAMDHN
ncbi:hypothetical protein J6590_039993 [Homalodisca vitripennis]|nr:hypothetical protein J6590_039993 [Homalodisca vitripennis]